jgi:hypothetical protein
MRPKAHLIARPTRRHAKELDGGEAFLHDTRWGFARIKEGDVEAFGEEFVAGATSNEPIGELARDEIDSSEARGFQFDHDAEGLFEPREYH